MEAVIVLGPILVGVGLVALSVRAVWRTERERAPGARRESLPTPFARP